MDFAAVLFAPKNREKIRKETQNAEKYTKNFTSGTGKDNDGNGTFRCIDSGRC